MILIWALLFGKGVVFVVYLFVAKDAWINLHTSTTNGRADVQYRGVGGESIG